MSWRDALEFLGLDSPGGRPIGAPVTRTAKPIGAPDVEGPRPLGAKSGGGFGLALDAGKAAGTGFGAGRGLGALVGRGFKPNEQGLGDPSKVSGFNPGMVDKWGVGWASRAAELGNAAVNEDINAARAALGLPPLESDAAQNASIWDDPFTAMIARAEGLTPPVSGGSGPVASVGQSSTPGSGGGAWAVQDQWDAGYAAASQLTGVPANFIKAIQRVETGGADKTGREVCDEDPMHPGDCLALNAGIWRTTAESWGLDYNRILKDPNYATIAIGTTLQHLAMSDAGDWGGTPGKTLLEDGGWEGVARVYHGGRDGYVNPGWRDSNGVSSGEYQGHVTNYVNQLDARSTSPGTNGQSVSSPQQPASGQVGNYNGKAIADLADTYATSGIQYEWGGIPREGQDPTNYIGEDGYQKHGWDCSGFVSFIFDNLGYSHVDIPGGLPDGSHYQAQWAIDNGRYHEGVDFSQMQPGDLIFMDTGGREGAGVGIVGPEATKASHVGIYLGDGKMINAMNPCGDEAGDVMGVTCGTGVVSVEDGYWGNAIVGWADTSDIIGGAATEVASDKRAGTGSVR